jgi:hypothetical protein
MPACSLLISVFAPCLAGVEGPQPAAGQQVPGMEQQPNKRKFPCTDQPGTSPGTPPYKAARTDG